MKTIVLALRSVRERIAAYFNSGGTFFVDQLSAEEVALFHDPERP